MATTPLLSVFMPVYNAEDFLRPAIESVLSQTFADFEFLIVDDGSTDGSVDVIRSYNDPRIRLIQQTNQGCYPARNRAIAESRGKYLANMDADDISLPERFEKQVGFLEEYSEAVLVGTRTLGCDMEDTVRLAQAVRLDIDGAASVPHALRPDSLREDTSFTCATIAFRRSLIDRIGAYDDRLCLSADVDFIARASSAGVVCCLPEYLYVFRLRPAAVSGAGARIQREILDLIWEANSRTPPNDVRSWTDPELQRLKELAELRHSLPSASLRVKASYYETRLATLLRTNGRPGQSLIHSLQAASLAPQNLFQDRKLLSNLLRGLIQLVVPRKPST